MSEKAQNEADTKDLDIFSHPHSASPHYRPGHSEFHNHGVSHHHDEPYHRKFQDFHDNAIPHHSHQSHHNSVAYHGRNNHTSSSGLASSQGNVFSHHSYDEGHFEDEHHQGNRMHLGGTQHSGRPHHHGQAQHHIEPSHHGKVHQPTEPFHQGVPHHHGRPQHNREHPHHGGYQHTDHYHRAGSYNPSEDIHHDGLHHDYFHHQDSHHQGRTIHHRDASPDSSLGSYHPSRPHHYDIHNHRRPVHHGDSISHYPSGTTRYQGEYLHGEQHHHKHHHGQHHHGPGGGHHSMRHQDYFHGDPHHREYHWYTSQEFIPYRSPSMTHYLGPAVSHIAPFQSHIAHSKISVYSATPSHIASHSHDSQSTIKVHPQQMSSKGSRIWDEDEQLQKRKTGRAQRTHKKLHSLNFFEWLWEKLTILFRGLRIMLRKLIQSLAFEAFIFFIICLNTIMLVAQTFAEVEVRGEWYFMALDSIFFCIYAVEAVLKIIALGLGYFYDAWNNLDFFIMIMALVDFVLMQMNSFSFSFYNQSLFRILKVFKSLRALRAIRVLRRLRILTSLQEVTGTLARTLPSITAILILMFTCLFLFSVVLRALFRRSDPKRFQNIFTTIFTLFTLLTLDDWSLIYMDSRAQGAWYIIPILMIYIIIQYFIFLNLVIAVLVDNFQMALLKGLEKVKQERAARINEKLLEDSLTELRKAEPGETVSEGTLQKQFIKKKFGNMTEKQQQLLFHFLQLVAGVEHHQQKFRSQAAIIDEIVDTAFEAGEEDFKK